MLPPSLRTGAWRTHHQRVATTADWSMLDIAKLLQYCAVSYVRARIVSIERFPAKWKPVRVKKTRQRKGSSVDMSVDIIWAFEILFEIPWCGKRRPA